MLRRATLTVLASLLVGCFPVRENYFEPSTNGIAAHGEMCHGDNGPPKVVSLEIGNGVITISAARSKRQPSIADVSIRFNRAGSWEQTGTNSRQYRYKAEESTLVIRTTNFSGYLATTGAPLKITPRNLRTIMNGNGVELPLQPNLKLVASSSQHSSFIMYFDVELDDVPEFSVVVPEFSVDGNVGLSRIIHFVEKNGIWIEPINC